MLVAVSSLQPASLAHKEAPNHSLERTRPARRDHPNVSWPGRSARGRYAPLAAAPSPLSSISLRRPKSFGSALLAKTALARHRRSGCTLAENQLLKGGKICRRCLLQTPSPIN